MQERLTLGPAWVQAVKLALTRARATAWRARGRPSRAGLRVVFYHRVTDDPDPLAISRRRFVAQMDLLRAEGYRVVDVIEAARLLAAGSGLERVVALSFDDGYRDVAEHALPVLERRDFRATVFVATGVIDGTASFSCYARHPPGGLPAGALPPQRGTIDLEVLAAASSEGELALRPPSPRLAEPVTERRRCRSRPTLTSVTGVRPAPLSLRGCSSSTPLWITTVRPARHVRARRPARRSLSATQIVIDVSGLIRRSAHR